MSAMQLRCSRLPSPSSSRGTSRKRCRGIRCSTQQAEPAAAAAAAPRPSYPYNSGDGRNQKATLEHIFQPEQATTSSSSSSSSSSSTLASSSGAIAAPWAVGWQMNERNVIWNDDLKLRLLKTVMSRDLGLSEEEVEERLVQLTNVLPGLDAYILRAPPANVFALLQETHKIGGRLLALKEIFPEADLTPMVTKRISLVLGDNLEGVAAAAQRLRELLPGINVDRFVEAHPTVLDIRDFEVALEDAERIMPGMDVAAMLRSNPDMILSLQKGRHQIPYDQLKNPFT